MLQICVVLLCGTGLLMMIPVTVAIVSDFLKSVKKILRE